MFSVFIVSIDQTHPGALELLKLGEFRVARSMVPGRRIDGDKTNGGNLHETLNYDTGVSKWGDTLTLL